MTQPLHQPTLRNSLLFIITSLITSMSAFCQLPDCTSGNVMYGVFTNIAGSTTADSTEIRSINYTTGAAGPLIGGKRYWIRKQIGTTWYYGTSSMGVSLVNNRFYIMTQMSNPGPKDIIAIDPVAGSTTVVGTTPTALNNYHFVKLAVAPNGFAYAIGVNRDTSQPANTFNPLVRFSTCGSLPTAGCATTTITVLGYLPTTGNMYKWKLFNGDIAFDVAGNLYFATAAYDKLTGTTMVYSDARLFKINVSDIPSTAGTGIIPMSLISEYNSLDSTVINGIALDLTGKMYLSTRVFSGPQNNPSSTQSPELYVSPVPGTTTKMTGFSSPTPNFSMSDLASCNFPALVLSSSEVRLTGRADKGNANLVWNLNNNQDVDYFELQRSEDANDFRTIATINASYTSQPSAKYSYQDNQSSFAGHSYYRVRATMKSGVRNYSNVANILIDDALFVASGPNPNPVIDRAEFKLSLKSKMTVSARIIDQRGSLVKEIGLNCVAGDNKVSLNSLGYLKAGMYIVEFRTDDQVVRTKMIKQ